MNLHYHSYWIQFTMYVTHVGVYISDNRRWHRMYLPTTTRLVDALIYGYVFQQMPKLNHKSIVFAQIRMVTITLYVYKLHSDFTHNSSEYKHTIILCYLVLFNINLVFIMYLSFSCNLVISVVRISSPVVTSQQSQLHSK